MAQRIINDADPAMNRRTAAGVDHIVVLALLALLAVGQRARALDLTAGPVQMPPGVQ